MMKSYSRFSQFLVTLVCLSSSCYAHFWAPPTRIHEFVRKSDLVVIGTVVKDQSVMNPAKGDGDISKLFIGALFTVRVDKVLYGRAEITQSIFSTSDLQRINSTLKRNPRKKSLNIYAFHQSELAWGLGMPTYRENRPQLFFFKVSKFPTNFPSNTLIYDGSQEYERESQIPTVASLKEKFYFEATSGTVDSTWDLTNKKEKEWVPIVEALGEVMSVPDLTQREQKLRELLNHDDVLLASNAEAALGEIKNVSDAKKTQVERKQNISVAQTPVKEKQIDVITDTSSGALRAEKVTVDAREAARNLHNKEIFDKVSRVLFMVDDAYLSSGTVNLLKTALNDNSVEVRQRAILLLGLSRNPEAIEVISNRLRNDPSWHVKSVAAVNLGILAGGAAVPVLKAALVEEEKTSASLSLMSKISPSLISGLGRAGGTAVPLLIERLKDDLKLGGHDANFIIQSLKWTGDRRAIKSLLAIISHPASPSDAVMSEVQLDAARALAHFATDRRYEDILKFRNKFAEGYPVTPRENRRVNASDRARIVEALKTAGYDINRLAERDVVIFH